MSNSIPPGYCYFPTGPVYHEGCDCPQPSGSVWEAHMHCPQSFLQIDRDLALFPTVDPDQNAQEIPQRFGQRQSLCHYTVKDNKVVQAKKQKQERLNNKSQKTVIKNSHVFSFFLS